MDGKISYAMIKRLPIYYRNLSNLRKSGIHQVSSKDLSTMMGINSSQVRTDFAYLGGEGLPGNGYQVDILLDKIRGFLGLNITTNMIVIGAGHLGHNLVKNKSLEKKGFKIIGVFDSNTNIIGKKIMHLEILELNALPKLIKKQQVDIAAITISGASANEVINTVIDCGVKAIWNFSEIELKSSDKLVIQNNFLDDSLLVLKYNLINRIQK